MNGSKIELKFQYNYTNGSCFKLIVGHTIIVISAVDNRIAAYVASPKNRIKNAFHSHKDIFKLASGKTITSLSGNVYDTERFARLIITAVCLKKEEYDMVELEELVDLHRKDYDKMVYILENNYHRFIGYGIRYGYGYRIVSDKRQYYAFHGTPIGNSDFFIYWEISEAEFKKIETEFPENYESSFNDAESFKNRFLKHHKALLAGRDCCLHPVEDNFDLP